MRSWVVPVDEEVKPRVPRPGTRRLRDISHLYLSTSPGARERSAAWPAAPRRRLRLAFATLAAGVAKVEICANLAIQFASLGRRTLVLDLDPALPNVGFRLGLEPRDYMAHLELDPVCRVVRAAHGLRIVEGWGPAAAGVAALQAEIGASECLLVNLPDAAHPGAGLADLLPLLEVEAVDTTLVRAAARSPMFGAWMATAQRPPAARRAPAPSAVDTTLWIVDGAAETAALPAAPPVELGAFSAAPVRPIVWGGDTSGSRIAAWARVPAHPHRTRLPISSLEPEHAAARLYESLAQSLLAGLGSSQGARRA